MSKNDHLNQEEIVRNTRTVAQNLDALKTEHCQILNALQTTRNATQEFSESSSIIERTCVIKKSLEMLELGLGEAQVSNFTFC